MEQIRKRKPDAFDHKKFDQFFFTFQDQLATIDPTLDSKECWKKVKAAAEIKQFYPNILEIINVLKKDDRIIVRLMAERRGQAKNLVFTIGTYNKIILPSDATNLSPAEMARLPREVVKTLVFEDSEAEVARSEKAFEALRARHLKEDWRTRQDIRNALSE